MREKNLPNKLFFYFKWRTFQRFLGDISRCFCKNSTCFRHLRTTHTKLSQTYPLLPLKTYFKDAPLTASNSLQALARWYQWPYISRLTINLDEFSCYMKSESRFSGDFRRAIAAENLLEALQSQRIFWKKSSSKARFWIFSVSFSYVHDIELLSIFIDFPSESIGTCMNSGCSFDLTFDI